MGKSATVTPATAAEVRAWFSENPTAVPEGDKSVGAASAQRGRLSKAAREAYTKATGRPVPTEAVVKTVSLNYVHVQPSGKKVKKVAQVTPKELRALVPNAPQRGVLSAAHIAAAGEAYAERVQAARA